MNVAFFPAHWALYRRQLKRGGGEGFSVCCCCLASHLPDTEIPEYSNPQKVPENSPGSAFTAMKIALGYALDTLPCCGCVLLSFLGQKEILTSSCKAVSWVFLMFSGPLETLGSGEGEDVGSLNSPLFFLYNQPSQQSGPSRKFASLEEGKSRLGLSNSMEGCQH